MNTTSILEQVLAAPVEQKRVILDALRQELEAEPQPAVHKVFTHEEIAEMRRRIDDADNSIDIQEFIDRL